MRLGGTKTLGAAVLLFAIGFYVTRELFFIEYIRHMSSIECTHIALGRNVLDHWRDLSWYPLWDGGTPFPNTYSPLLPYSIALLAKLASLPVARAYHILVAAAYCLGPVGVFFLARSLSASGVSGFAAGLIYSLTSFSALLVPAIARDLGSVLGLRRLQDLVFYGEGPHVISLTFLPLAILCLHRAACKPRPHRILLAILSSAAVVATNWVGSFSLLLSLAAYFLAAEGKSVRRRIVEFGCTAIAPYFLLMAWIPPSTILLASGNPAFLMGIKMLSLEKFIFFLIALWLAATLRHILFRCSAGLAVRFACYFLLFTSLLTLTAHYFQVQAIPQATRYELEMEMGVCLLLSALVTNLAKRLRAVNKGAVLAGILLLMLALTLRSRQRALAWIQPVEIQHTVEFNAARVFELCCPDSRVFAPGSIGYWLNVFVDIQQIGTGSIQAVENKATDLAYYEIMEGSDSAKSLLWLRALGVRAIGVTFPDGAEVFKGFKHPAKFEAVLPVHWRQGGDVIYLVPSSAPSLAHVMRASDLVPRSPLSGDDVQPLQPYVRALENTCYAAARFSWRQFKHAHIVVDIMEDQVISVQVNYRPGWKASINGTPIPVLRDALGFMVLRPQVVARDCTVDLWYDGGMEMRISQLSSGTAILGAMIWVVWDFRRTRRLRW